METCFIFQYMACHSDFPHTLEKNVCPAVVGYSVLLKPIKSGWLIVLKLFISLMICFRLLVLSITDKRVLKSPVMFVILSISLFMSIFASHGSVIATSY